MNFFDQSCFPWVDDYPADLSGLQAAMGRVHWAALAHSPWDHAGEPGFWRQLRANAIALREQSQRAILAVVGCNLFEWGTFLHSCGSIHALLADLIEAGFEVVNPVPTACRDMAAARLKNEFGRDITFSGGGADSRAILNHGTPAEVRGDVWERLAIFAPGGGFVFNTIHNILADVPPQNIVALFAAIEEYNSAGT